MTLLNPLRKHCPNQVKTIARKIFECIMHISYRISALVHADKVLYYCPCCKLKLIEFVDGKFYERPERYNPMLYKTCQQDVLCPFCNSLPRHRILATWCSQHIDNLKGSRILYFALEKGMKLWLKRNRLVYTTADLFFPADLALDLNNIEQDDNSWDIVFCNHVLEHVPDYRKALGELYRILVPGGRLICSFPIDSNYETVFEDASLVQDELPEVEQERIRKFGQKDHLRVFGRDSVKLLEAAGFSVTIIDGDTMPASILPIVGPADYDSNKLFVCEKITNKKCVMIGNERY